MSKSYQVVGIGNAVVDVIAHADDSFLDHMGITKGIMQLVERDRSETLFAAMDDRQQIPGGSVANTLAGIGNLGLKTAFVGRVRDDALGLFYRDALVDSGTDFPNPPVEGADLPTSRSMIFVSPDGERSMNTYLGISSEVGPDDVSTDVMENAEILFLEGYLYDKPQGKEAFNTAADACTGANGMAGIALSDPFCVDRHRADFKTLIADHLDYVIGNEHEIKSLWEVDDLEEALEKTTAICGTVVCTRSGDPVILIEGDTRVEVPVKTVVPVDATGAGDQFAAGFLYGLSQKLPLTTCGRMGCVAASEVISHIGARPEANLIDLFKAEGLV